MKKFLAISFALFYVLASIGVTLNVHYCHGEVKYVQMATHSEDCCCGDESATITCCDTDTIFLQYDNDDQIHPNQRSVKELGPVAWVGATSLNTFHPDIPEKINLQHLNLPPPPRQPLWLLNCTFTYYG